MVTQITIAVIKDQVFINLLKKCKEISTESQIHSIKGPRILRLALEE